MAKIERAAADVSLDQLVRALTAAGGRITVKVAANPPGKSRKQPATSTTILEATTFE
ncbi:MAG: hypothetical protein SH850_12665 [Planctomycetaceae bacterium]|nr:hypothetical protein [Planctomycetaceae bacterium]